MPTSPTEFIENPLDCWITPPEVCEFVMALWSSGVDFDPFWDPQALIESNHTYDIREGQDAYILGLGPLVRQSRTMAEGRARGFMNGPYSSRNPQYTAAMAANAVSEFPRLELLNLCPAAPGSDYWRRYVWPFADAVLWMGRTSFVAGRDILFPANHKRAGEVKFHAGQVVHGNRTEIATVYNGPDVRRLLKLGEHFGYAGVACR